MENRFRRMPPRIQPRYETQDVSPPRPLPEVEETVFLSPAGQVDGIARLADEAVRESPRRPRARRILRVILAVWLAAALVGIAVAIIEQYR